MARFAIYLRRSSPGDEDKNYSIEAQRLDIETRWAEYGQHELIARYSDPGGKSYTLARPVFHSMMLDARARRFDILVVGRWDRFSRIQEQQAVAIYQLRQYGVKVISATEPIPDGPVGALIRNNYAFAAELELYNLRERTYGGKKRRVQSGKLPGQPGPLYGYLFADKEKTRYVIDPETAPTVRYIFSLFLAGLKLRAISRRLKAEGIMPPSAIWAQRGWSKGRNTATEWNHTTLYKMLTNTAYIGRYVGFCRRTEDIEVVNPVTREVETLTRQIERAEDDPDRVVYDVDVCPAIIEELAFHAVQALLPKNKQDSSRRVLYPEACLLRNGFARCGYCGGYMIGNHVRRTGEHRYRCTKHGDGGCPGGRFSWSASELDSITWGFLLEQFKRSEILRAKYEAWKADNAAGRNIEADRIEALEAQMKTAEKRRKLNMLLAGDEEDEDQRAEYQLIATNEAKRLKRLRGEHAALTAVIASQDQQEKILDELTQAGILAAAQLQQFDYDSKRRTLYALNVEMRVGKKGEANALEFYWAFGDVFARTMQYLDMDGAAFSVNIHRNLFSPSAWTPARVRWASRP
jgi:site-specific DNA recombinase